MKKLLVIGLISSSLLLGGCFKEDIKSEAKKELQENIQVGLQSGSLEVKKIEEINSGTTFNSGSENTGNINKNIVELQENVQNGVMQNGREEVKKIEETNSGTTFNNGSENTGNIKKNIIIKNSEKFDVSLSILDYYGLTFLSDTFKIDNKEKCLSVIKKFSDIKNNIDCDNNYTGEGFGNLMFGIEEKGNDFYNIYLGEGDLGGLIFLDDIYSNTTKKTFSGVYLTGNNLGLINFPKYNKSNFTIKSKDVSIFKDTFNVYTYLSNKDIGDFQMIINYKLKENTNYDEIKNLLKGNFPYELVLEQNNNLGMGDSYKDLKNTTNELNKPLTIFNKKGIYFADEWGSGISSDIFILTTDIPENKYFSEIVIYFINTNSYQDKKIENMILGFVEELKWQNNFILD